MYALHENSQPQNTLPAIFVNGKKDTQSAPDGPTLLTGNAPIILHLFSPGQGKYAPKLKGSGAG
jgi:hypothetical protein